MGFLTAHQRACRQCGETKPLDAFPKRADCAEGRAWKCKECANAYLRTYRTTDKHKQYVADNRDAERQRRRARYEAFKSLPDDVKSEHHAYVTYKLTPDAYRALLANGCEVCGSREDLCIDHDHNCCPGPRTCGNCIRGVLCQRHNKAEGLLNGSPDEAMALAAYMLKNVNVLESL